MGNDWGRPNWLPKREEVHRLTVIKKISFLVHYLKIEVTVRNWTCEASLKVVPNGQNFLLSIIMLYKHRTEVTLFKIVYGESIYCANALVDQTPYGSIQSKENASNNTLRVTYSEKQLYYRRK